MNRKDKIILSDKRALSINEAAKYACVSCGTIKNWIAQGLMPYEELPGRGKNAYRFRRIRLKDLDEFLDKFYKVQKKKIEENISNELFYLPRSS